VVVVLRRGARGVLVGIRHINLPVIAERSRLKPPVPFLLTEPHVGITVTRIIHEKADVIVFRVGKRDLNAGIHDGAVVVLKGVESVSAPCSSRSKWTSGVRMRVTRALHICVLSDRHDRLVCSVEHTQMARAIRTCFATCCLSCRRGGRALRRARGKGTCGNQGKCANGKCLERGLECQQCRLTVVGKNKSW
jgi:hypothetical protein